MTFKLPSTTVFIDADIEALREHGADTFDPKSAASLVDQYDAKGHLSDKQWGFVTKLLRSTAASRQPIALGPDLTILKAHGHLLGSRAPTAADFVKRGEAGYSFSPAQLSFIASLARQARETSEPRPAAPAVSTTIVALFDKAAAAGLQVPHIAARHFYAYRATAQSKNPGSVTILSKRGGAYYGSIMRDGTLRLGRDCPPAAVEQIKAFAADPITASVVEGRTTGVCVFCGSRLDTDASQTVGYGPICSQRYNLPWGETIVKHNKTLAAEDLMK
jgi:hypothetical protein